jgi:hypothetical protein
MSTDPIRPSHYTEPAPASPAVPAGAAGSSGYTVPADLVPPRPARIDALRYAARFTIVGLALSIPLELISVVLTGMTAAFEPGPNLDDPLTLAATVELMVEAGVLIVTAVAFISWLYLALKNIQGWRIAGLSWGPGWAIGGWLIPLANLVIPALVVNAAYKGSEAPAGRRYPGYGRPGLIVAWWLTFVIGGRLQNASGRDVSGQGVVYPVTYTTMEAALAITAALLAIAIVRAITRLQSERQAALDTSQQDQMGPVS